MKVHERVKVYLDKHNITQKELSKETKIPETTLSLILRGGRNDVTPKS
jgi:transcriptional regulator with XRE-family HTH domain